MFNDTMSDVLTRIRNAGLIKSPTVRIPLTRLTQQLCHILEKEGYIASFQREENQELSIHLKYIGAQPCMTNLRRISRPGLRIYTKAQEIPQVLGGMGIVIVSTSKGLMTDREARYRRLGGELVCSVW